MTEIDKKQIDVCIESESNWETPGGIKFNITKYIGAINNRISIGVQIGDGPMHYVTQKTKYCDSEFIQAFREMVLFLEDK